jgi:hypothetical protein
MRVTQKIFDLFRQTENHGHISDGKESQPKGDPHPSRFGRACSADTIPPGEGQRGMGKVAA